MALALATGIAPSVWADEGDQAMATAWELIERQHSKQQTKGPRKGPQMSG